MSKDYTPRLKKKYDEQIRSKLKEEFGYTNDMQIPKIDKVVINMGVGEAVADSKKIKTALAEMEKIAGQKPVITKAKKGGLHNYRQVLAYLGDVEMTTKLFEDVGPRYAERPGGYTRILKLGPRQGDNAPMAKIELV